MPELTTLAINDAVAAELRACAARKGLNGTQVAHHAGVPKMYVHRRLSQGVEISVGDLVLLSQAIGVAPLDVLAQSLIHLDAPDAAAAGT